MRQIHLAGDLPRGALIEIAGGFSGEQAVSSHTLLKATARELEGRLTARADGAETKKAGRPLVSQLAALELYVMDSSKIAWLGGYAWSTITEDCGPRQSE